MQREGLVLTQSRGNDCAIASGYLFSGVDPHHVGEHLVRKRSRRRRGAAPPPEDRSAGGCDDLGADVFAEAAGAVVGKSPHAPALKARRQPVGIAGQLDQNHQEGRNVRVIEREIQRLDPRIGLTDLNSSRCRIYSSSTLHLIGLHSCCLPCGIEPLSIHMRLIIP